MEHFLVVSKEQYNPKMMCIVDEMMLTYKGRYYNIQQYMKRKPVKFDIRIWALASSQSRCISNIIVYFGTWDVREEDGLVGTDTVLVAVRGMEGHSHVIITDNFFISIKLFTTLLERGFYSTTLMMLISVGYTNDELEH